MGETFDAMEVGDWELAKGAAIAGNPQWAGYADSIKKLVELYSGGPGFPMILEQDEFARSMGENRRMGEDFATVIVSTQLDTYNPRMHVRHFVFLPGLGKHVVYK